MAAEKLTKGRLAQILFMMAVLIIAFVWRSVTHSNNEIICTQYEDCTVDINDQKLTFIWQNELAMYHVNIVPSKDELSIQSMNSNATLSYNEVQTTLNIDSLPVRIKVTNKSKPEQTALYINIQ
jgi:hypothetical protein